MNIKKGKATGAKLNPKHREKSSKKIPIQGNNEEDFFPFEQTQNVKMQLKLELNLINKYENKEMKENQTIFLKS